MFLLVYGQSKKKIYIGLLLFFSTLILMQKLYFHPIQVEAEAQFFIEKSEKNGSYFCYLKKMDKKRVELSAKLYSDTALNEGNWYLAKVHATKYEQFYLITSLNSPECIKKSRFFFMQKKCKSYLRQKIELWYPQKIVQEFITSLLIGEKTSNNLSSTFRRIGCSHLLAISGFHFGLIAFFAHCILLPFFSLKPRMCLLMLTLFCYLLFIGSAASALRAFLFSFVYTFAPIFERKNSPINTLGIALGLSICIAPLKVLDIGFQLSFLATAAILLFYKPIKQCIVGTASFKPWRFLLDAIALNLAVHLALFPVMLAIFHQLPLHSFLYNLFFPQMTALSLLAFFSFLLLHPVLFFLTPYLHKINQAFTFFYLQIAENQWIYEQDLFVEKLSGGTVAASFILFYFLAIFAESKANHLIRF